MENEIFQFSQTNLQKELKGKLDSSVQIKTNKKLKENERNFPFLHSNKLDKMKIDEKLNFQHFNCGENFSRWTRERKNTFSLRIVRFSLLILIFLLFHGSVLKENHVFCSLDLRDESTKINFCFHS